MTNAAPEPESSLSETYLQISPNILASFPKFRPPVDLYFHDPKVFGVGRLHRAEQRLNAKAQEEVARICSEGNLFLFRNDYRVYAKHISKRLGLVLTETGLDEREVAEIFFIALADRAREFFAQPLEPTLEALRADVSILSEYVWTDPCRIGFMLRCLDKHYDLAGHSVNTAFIGLGLFVMHASKDLDRLGLNDIVLGLLVHDLGMSKVPGFITGKEGALLRQDRQSVVQHVGIALSMLERLRVQTPPVLQCIAEHHERFDGSGYPRGLKGAAISLPGRICGLADAFVAMVSQRPHRPAMDPGHAVRTLLAGRDEFDPVLCREFLDLLTHGLPQCTSGGLLGAATAGKE